MEDLPSERQWREWMHRIKAMLFASTSPVGREDLVRDVVQGALVDLLVEDLTADLERRPIETQWARSRILGHKSNPR